MKPTLNQADIELLKSIFPTKEEINSRFDQLDVALAKSFDIIETRLSKLEHILDVKPAN